MTGKVQKDNCEDIMTGTVCNEKEQQTFGGKCRETTPNNPADTLFSNLQDLLK